MIRRPPRSTLFPYTTLVWLVKTVQRYSARRDSARRRGSRSARGSMRIVGRWSPSAPRACSARTRSPPCSRARVTTMRRPASGDRNGSAPPPLAMTRLQSHRPQNHNQAMWRSFRAAFARFAVRRASACQGHAPRRAARWLRLACSLTPSFAESYPALVALSRTLEDRFGALAAAQEAAVRFPGNPDAWMLLGDAYLMVFKQKEALHAYEQVLALEDRADAAMAAGQLDRRAGQAAEAAARFARAYAAGAAPGPYGRMRR